ncbi:hypothetical protein K8I61_03735 [bacterium]|nr:hypothetical protein [bacterium]
MRLSRAAGLFLIACAFAAVMPAIARAGQCAIGDLTPVYDDIEAGEYEAAHARLDAWLAPPVCPDAAAGPHVIAVTVGPGLIEELSPRDLHQLVVDALAWERTAKEVCDPLAGDDIGRAARAACLDRRAENMDAIGGEVSRRLLADVIRLRALRLAEGETAPDLIRAGEEGLDAPSEGSGMAIRAAAKTHALAREICDMRRELERLDTKYTNMQRQTPFMKTEFAGRTARVEKSREIVRDALARARGEFRAWARRDFDPEQDCVISIPAPPLE